MKHPFVYRLTQDTDIVYRNTTDNISMRLRSGYCHVKKYSFIMKTSKFGFSFLTLQTTFFFISRSHVLRFVFRFPFVSLATLALCGFRFISFR